MNDLQGVVLDNCIPTHGVAQWMEQSNCLLLKEKTAYALLYEALGLVSYLSYPDGCQCTWK